MPPKQGEEQNQEEVITSEVTEATSDEETESAPPAEGEGNQEPQSSASAPQPEEDALPEKYRGKTAKEIAEMHLEAEKKISQQGAERAEAVRRAQELDQEVQQYRDYFSRQQQGPQDPIQVLEERWNDSPKEAIRGALEFFSQQRAQEAYRQQQEAQARATAVRYEELRKSDPELPELEPEMIRLSHELADFVPQDKRNSPQVLDALYQMARARKIDTIVDKRVQSALKKLDTKRTEKREAFSESGKSQGEVQENFDDLSLEEMRQRLPSRE